MTSTPAQSDEILRKKLLQYTWPSPFPQHSPPIEVVFTNGMRTSDDDREHYVFSMPYATFSVAMEAIIAAEKARIFDAVEGAIVDEPCYDPETGKQVQRGDSVTIDTINHLKESLVFIESNGKNNARDELRAAIKRLREGDNVRE